MAKMHCFHEKLLHEKKDIERYEKLMKAFPFLNPGYLRTAIGIIQTEDNNSDVPTVRRLKFYLHEREIQSIKEAEDVKEHEEMFMQRRNYPADFSAAIPHYRLAQETQSESQQTHSRLEKMLETAMRTAGINVQTVATVEDAIAWLNYAGFEKHTITNMKDKTIVGFTIEASETADGKPVVVLIGNNIKPSTAIHEYTHVWAQAIRKLNQETWSRIKEAMLNNRSLEMKGLRYEYIGKDGMTHKATAKTLGEFCDAIRSHYDVISDEPLSDDYWAEEILAHLTERIGVATLLDDKKIAKKIDELYPDENESEKAEKQLSVLRSIFDALKDFWKFVTQDLFKIKKEFKPKDISKCVLQDLLNNVLLTDIGKEEYPFRIKEGASEKIEGNVFEGKDEKGKKVKKNYTYSISNKGGRLILEDMSGNPIDTSQLSQPMHQVLRGYLDYYSNKATIVSIHNKKYFVNYQWKITSLQTGETTSHDIVKNQSQIWAAAEKNFKDEGIRPAGLTDMVSSNSMRSKMMFDMLTDKKVGSTKAAEIVQQLANSFSQVLDEYIYYFDKFPDKIETFNVKNWVEDFNEKRKALIRSKALPTLIKATYLKVISNTDEKHKSDMQYIIEKYSQILMYNANVLIRENEGFSLFKSFNLFSTGFVQIGATLDKKLTEGQKKSISLEVSNDNEEKAAETDEALSAIEGWMIEPNEKSISETMSLSTKRITNSIVSGNKKYFNGASKHVNRGEIDSVLLDVISKCEKPEDFLPELKKAAEIHSWIYQIIDVLGGRNTSNISIYNNSMSSQEKELITLNLQANFWNDYHKAYTDFTSLKLNGNGLFEIYHDNNRSGIDLVKETLRNALQSTFVFDNELGFYDENGLYSIENYKRRKEIYDNTQYEISPNGKLSENASEKIVPALHSLLTALGYDIELENIQAYIDSGIKEYQEKEKTKKTTRLNELLSKIEHLDETLYKRLINESDDSKKLSEDDEKNVVKEILRKRLLGQNETKYLQSEQKLTEVELKKQEQNQKIIDDKKDFSKMSITQLVNPLIEGSGEGFATVELENERKRLWSHSNYNEMHKLFDIILRSPERAREYFMSKAWFRNGDKSFVSWINKIIDGKYRPMLQQLASFNKMEFKKMNMEDYLLSTIHVYFSSDKYRVMLPILSDVTARYTVNKPETITSKEDFLNKSVDLVLQELKRIKAVKSRKYLPENKKIVNFDDTGDLFHYFPQLNAVKDGNQVCNEELYNAYISKAEQDPEGLVQIIKEKLSPVIDDMLRSNRKYYSENGVNIVNKNVTYDFLRDNKSKLDKKLDSFKKESDKKRYIANYYNNLKYFEEKVFHTYMRSRMKFVDFDKSVNYDDVLNVIYDELDYVNEEFDNFILDSMYANAQLENILFGDPAFAEHQSRNAADLQKRIKQPYTPVRYAYTNHFMLANPAEEGNYETVEVTKYTRKKEYSITLKDATYDMRKNKNLKTAFDNMKANNMISQKEYDMIMAGLKDVTPTDGQTFRSLCSKIRMLCMTGGMSSNELYDAMMTLAANKRLTSRQMKLIRDEVVKPFVSSYSTRRNPAVEEGADYDKIDVRVQHKNAEFTLLYAFAQIASFDYPPVLKGLSQFMEARGIDKANFESVEKIGCSMDAIELSEEAIMAWKNENNIPGDEVTQEDVFNYLDHQTGLDKVFPDKAVTYAEAENYLEHADDNIIHSIPMSDWGISTDMGEYFDDVNKRAMGSQPQLMVMEDIPNDAVTKISVNEVFDENGDISEKFVKLNREHLHKIYYKLITRDVMSRFKKLSLKFKNAKDLRNMIADSLMQQGREGDNDLMYYLELDASETYFIHPWLNPIVSERLESIITSKYRKEIQKRNFRMDVIPQVSAFGLDDELAARFKDENGHMFFNEKEFKSGRCEDLRQQQWLNKVRKDCETFDEYVERYVNGKKQSLLYMEVAVSPYTMSLESRKACRKSDGSIDFEMLKQSVTPQTREFFGYRVPFEAKHSGIPCFIKQFLPYQNAEAIITPREWIAVSDSDNDADKMYCMFHSLNSVYDSRGNFIKDECVEFKINPELVRNENESNEEIQFRLLMESIDSNSDKANKNLLLNMIMGVMQSDYNTGRIFTPGGFPTIQKVAAAMQQLIEVEELSDQQIKDISNKKVDTKVKLDTMSTYIDPKNQAELFKKNTMAKRLISIFAVERSFAVLFEEMGLTLNANAGVINLNNNESLPKDGNKTILTLSALKNSLGDWITENINEFLGAAVDGVKKPCLTYLGLDENTAPLAMLLGSLGYDIWEASFFVRLPIVQEIMSMRGSIVDHVETKLKSKKYNVQDRKPLTNESMAKQIRDGKRGDVDIDTSALLMLGEIAPILDEFKSVILSNRCHVSSALKSNSRENALYIINRMIKSAVINESDESKLPINNLDVFYEEHGFVSNENNAFERDEIDVEPLKPEVNPMDTKVPFVNAYYMYVMEGIRSLYDRFNITAIFKDGCMEMLHKAYAFADDIGNKLSQSDVSKLVEAMGKYFVSRVLYENLEQGTSQEIFEEKKQMFEMLPKILNNVKRTLDRKNDKLGAVLVNNLEIAYDSNDNMFVKFKNIDRVTKMKCQLALREMIDSEYSDVKIGKTGVTYKDFAQMLITYQLLRDGFRRSYYNNIIDVFPADLFDKLNGYSSMIQKMRNFNKDNIDDIDLIIDQYVAHEAYNEKSISNSGYSNIPFVVAIDVNELMSDEEKKKGNKIDFIATPIIKIKKSGNVANSIGLKEDACYPKYINFYSHDDETNNIKLKGCYKLLGSDIDDIVYGYVMKLGERWQMQEYIEGKKPYYTEESEPEILHYDKNEKEGKNQTGFLSNKYESVIITSTNEVIDANPEIVSNDLYAKVTDAIVQKLKEKNSSSNVTYERLETTKEDELGNALCVLL